MKKILAILLCLTVVFISVTPFVFSEKEEVNVEDAIKYLVDNGIMEGYPDGGLYPENTLTRAEFAKILSKAFSNESEYLHKDFSDVPQTHWAYDVVKNAANAGWLTGYPDGTFRPDENVTYEQAITIVCRISDIFVAEGKYPYGYISTAIDYNLTDGVDSLIGEPISRLQAAQLIVNCMEMEKYNQDYDYEYVYTSGGGSAGGGAGGGAISQNSFMPMESADYLLDSEDSSYYTPWYNFNTESYTANEENIFKDVSTSPLSTFSIDTDTASYSNMRRFIINGQKIPNGAIRTEELINYFDYAKAEIEDGKPFGVNFTVSQCPWNSENKLAMITVSGEELKESKPSNIVFLIDVSGSMDSYNKLPLVKQSLKMLLDKLGENDRISIVTYASGTGVALEPTPATEKSKIINAMNNLHAGGGTAGESGIRLAYEQAERYKCDGNNRIILCTDGDFNIGISSDSELKKLIEEKRESGIYLSVLGFGMGNYKDSMMETLADNGNGTYSYIDNLKEAKKVLVDEMPKTIYTIAKDVKIQVEFNPEKVKEYRLVGYENRLLNNEDFENDQKDAGELGAGATVTVLYEIVPADDEYSRQLKYQKSVSLGSDELMTVNIRYKEPDGNSSILCEYPVSANITEMTEDFKFASSVAMLGMILNDSEYMGTSNLDDVIKLAIQGKGEDPYGIRNEFVQLVDLYRYKINQ